MFNVAETDDLTVHYIVQSVNTSWAKFSLMPATNYYQLLIVLLLLPCIAWTLLS